MILRDLESRRTAALWLLVLMAACGEAEPHAPPNFAAPGASTTGVPPTGGAPILGDAGLTLSPQIPAADAGAMWPDAQGVAPEDQLWCRARGVLQGRCQTCHGSEPAGAPMALVTHADTQRPSLIESSKTVAQALSARIHDSVRPMPPVAQGPLTGEELAALDAWLAAGSPGGSCETPDVVAPVPQAEFKWPEECQEFYKIQSHQNGQPYTVPANYEGNVAIDIPVPWAGKGSGPVQAIAIKPLTNNKRVVHHWILYHNPLNFITSWSPGKQAETFPSDVGVYMPVEGTFRLNMHYYNVGNQSAEKDQSGLEICITRTLRPKTATTKMLGPVLFSVPGTGRSEITHVCSYNGNVPVTLITSSPHMHSYGIAAKFEVLRANGSLEVLDDTPFNWEDQKIKPIETVLQRGDKVRTTCIYQNNTGKTIRFGESSEDEMCFNFARYYPMDALSCALF